MSAVRLRSGIIPVSRDEANELAGAVRALGYDVVRIDLESASTKDAVLDRLASSLAFPDHFGRNWDALADCLGDLDLRGSAGLLVVLDGLAAYAADDPGGTTTLLEILDEASIEHAVHGRIVAFARIAP